MSTVIMILIVTIAMSLLFTFFVGYASDFQQGQGSAGLELIEVEDVWFMKSPASCINVSMYNYGEVDVNITSVYLDDLPYHLYKYEGSLMTEISSVFVPSGGHADGVLVQVNWVHQENYHVKFVSERGASFEGVYWSPMES